MLLIIYGGIIGGKEERQSHENATNPCSIRHYYRCWLGCLSRPKNPQASIPRRSALFADRSLPEVAA